MGVSWITLATASPFGVVAASVDTTISNGAIIVFRGSTMFELTRFFAGLQDDDKARMLDHEVNSQYTVCIRQLCLLSILSSDHPCNAEKMAASNSPGRPTRC